MILNGETDVHDGANGLPIIYPLTEVPVANNNAGKISKWAREAAELMGSGELESALHYMNLCLDEKFRNKLFPETIVDIPTESAKKKYKLSDSDELILLEKRCLVQMRLKMYDKVWEGAARIISKRSNHSVAFKCILASLCKTDKYAHVTDVLSLWKQCAPNDLEMIEARTTVESCCNAVKNGVEPSDVFSNIEEMLGLGLVDWMTGHKIYEPQWKYRPVPPGNSTFVLCLQHRFGHCSLGEKCPDAHGGEELEEWKIRNSISNLSTMLACSQLDRQAGYIKNIIDQLELGEEKEFLAHEVPGISVKCPEPMKMQIQPCTARRHCWEFQIQSTRDLKAVCLLYEVHRPYFKIDSAHFCGEASSLNLKTGELASESSLQLLEVSLCAAALALTGSLRGVYNYTISITCTPDVFGTFRQTVLFDFGGVPKLIRDISLEVVPPVDEEGFRETLTPSIQRPKYSETKESLFAGNLKTTGTWNFGNADIVDSVTGERVSSSKVGFALMTSPSVKNVAPSGAEKESHFVLSKETYRDRMRLFLTQEERARQVILSKYNISAHLTICDSFDMKSGANEGTRYSVDGNLFARMTLFRDICEDTPVGRLILRSCNSVLLTKTQNVNKNETLHSKPRVYLCSIIEKTKNSMFFEVGNFCVKELKLSVSEVSSFDIQFQLDRTTFMEQKKVIDQLTDFHLDMLFPDFTKDFHIPWNPFLQWNPSVESRTVRLNPKQKEAFNAVTVKTNKTPPILIIGPFGTGKTFTLFQCIKKLLSEDSSRIMICTHSNSAADLYIKEYLDPIVKGGYAEAKPLRIYYSLRSKLTVQKEIRPYCLYDNMDRFRRPTKEEVLKHRIIVVTLSTSFMLIDLDLPSDTFSHILLDEAAQAMESEAITPLLAAGENTKLVLAGDHMQLSPELFSEDASHFHASLLERLHCLYPDSHPCKLMLCENYRSHSSIIKFASDSFYQKKLECGMNQPAHERYYPLTFFAARGEDVQDQDSTSYYNMAEVFEVSERVSGLVNTWPEKWGDWKKDNQIGVLTPYPDQVNRIRQRLRKKGLYSVSVERVLNVQGKQFRAVFLSTVRTHKPWVRILPETVCDEVDLGFFSNPKLLNTALTRAQSLVAVVGDPVSLCALGKCRRLWEDFISICEMNKSLHGMTFAQIRQNIRGVEMRLKWGLNPLAKEFEVNEFVPKSEDATVLSTTSIPSAPLKALLPAHSTCAVSTAELQVTKPPSPPSTRFSFSNIPNPWQNTNNCSQNFPVNYTQYHPQNQVPMPMMPVPIVMNTVPTPRHLPTPRGMPPQPCPPFSVLPRPPIGYPPLGQGYIAVPIHHRAASAFAQYRAPHPTSRPSIAPPTFPVVPGPGLTYPTMLPPNHKSALSNPSPLINHGNPQMARPSDNYPWGQPLSRPNEYHSGPPPYLPLPSQGMDQRQNTFYPSSQQSNFGNLPQRPLGPSYHHPPQTVTQHNNVYQPTTSRSIIWQSSQPATSHSTSCSGGLVQNHKLSAEELAYLQRILDERRSASTAPDAAIESIKEKLTQAEQFGGLSLSNRTTSIAVNNMSGLPLSHNSVGSQLNTTLYPHGDGLSQAQQPRSNLFNCKNLTNELNALQLSQPAGYNRWAADASSNLEMDGFLMNGHSYSNPSLPCPSNSDHFLRNNSLVSENDGHIQNTELTVGWLGSKSDSISSTNNHLHSYTNAKPQGPTGNHSSNSASGRSYASAVKKPIIQTSCSSPPLSVETNDYHGREQEKLHNNNSAAQPKPLMEMNVDFPFPLNYSPPHRSRGSSTPPPRFRAASVAKKGKKKK